MTSRNAAAVYSGSQILKHGNIFGGIGIRESLENRPENLKESR
tara:strand:+ start:627 stop:755 length:129 start_codon:yes stop_codon:yes gene_type:complete